MQSINEPDIESTPHADPGQENESGRRGPIGFLYPAYGPLEALLGFGLFALFVNRLTPAAMAALAGPYPSLVAPVTTAAAVLLWLVAAVTVLTVVLDQVNANPRIFADRTQRDAFLDEHRPTETDYRQHFLMVILGGATAALAWDTALEVLSSTIPIVIEYAGQVVIGGQLPASITLGNVVILVVFFVGFAACARAVDRLLVGGAREFLYRHHANDWD